MSVTRTADRHEPRPPNSRPSRTSRTSRTSRRSRPERAPGTARTTRAETAGGPAPAQPPIGSRNPDGGPVGDRPTPQRNEPAESEPPNARTRARGRSAHDRSASSRARRARRSRPDPTGLARAPRHRILLACTGALAAGLFAVLMLNTIISQGAFRQNELEITLIDLAEREERLARELQIAESPLKVERAARKLGMVPAASPVFLSLADGRVLGEPVPAVQEPGRVSFKGAPGLLRVAAPSATPSAAASAGAEPPTSAPSATDPTTNADTPTDPALEPAPQPEPSAAAEAPQSDGASAVTGPGAQQ